MDYNAENKKKCGKKSFPRARSNQGILFLIVPKLGTLPLRHPATVNMNTYYVYILSRLNFGGFFLVFNACSFLHNFFIIDVILMNSFLCMHHVGCNVFCRSVLFDSLHLLLKNLLWKCVYFSKFTYTAMICTIVWFSSFLAV